MNYFERIINLETNEEIIREYTPEEVAEMELLEAKRLAKLQVLQNREAKRQSALNKLIDLGLSEEEIAAL